MSYYDPPDQTPVAFLPVIEPDPISLHDAVHAIRATGKFNSFDRAGSTNKQE